MGRVSFGELEEDDDDSHHGDRPAIQLGEDVSADVLGIEGEEDEVNLATLNAADTLVLKL